jgi:hypothetical protein
LKNACICSRLSHSLIITRSGGADPEIETTFPLVSKR